MTQQNARLITLDAAEELAKKAKVIVCTKRWWKRRIAEGRIQSIEGLVTYVYEAEVIDAIELVREATKWERRFGETYIDVGEEMTGRKLGDRDDNAA